jgi:hypothetical protein
VLAALVERGGLRQDAMDMTINLLPLVTIDINAPDTAGAVTIVRSVPLRIRRVGPR